MEQYQKLEFMTDRAEERDNRLQVVLVNNTTEESRDLGLFDPVQIKAMVDLFKSYGAQYDTEDGDMVTMDFDWAGYEKRTMNRESILRDAFFLVKLSHANDHHT